VAFGEEDVKAGMFPGAHVVDDILGDELGAEPFGNTPNDMSMRVGEQKVRFYMFGEKQ